MQKNRCCGLYILFTALFGLIILGQVALWEYDVPCHAKWARIINRRLYYREERCDCIPKGCGTSCSQLISNQQDGPCCNGGCTRYNGGKTPSLNYVHCVVIHTFDTTVEMELVDERYNTSIVTTFTHQFPDSFHDEQSILSSWNQTIACSYTIKEMGLGNTINLHLGVAHNPSAYIILSIFGFMFWIVATAMTYSIVFQPKVPKPSTQEVEMGTIV